jgi:flagellar hook-basal body complex protein FliE
MSAIPSLDPALRGWIKPESTRPAEAAGGFKQALAQTVQEINGLQTEADQAIQAMSVGEPKDVHEVMIAMEKAGISLRLMVQVRNKILAAYEEIMRLQV